VAAVPKVNGRPEKSKRANPTTTDKLAEAVNLYERFHWGEPATEVVRKRVSRRPRVATSLGRLHSVTYETSKGGEPSLWEHEFGEEGGEPPDLVADEDRRLHIVGGDYDVEDRGIVD